MFAKQKIDNFPEICTAGIKSKPEGCVDDNFKWIIPSPRKSIIELRKCPKVSENLTNKFKTDYKQSGAKELLNPPIKTAFQTLKQNINETIYHSSKNRPLGRSRITEPCSYDDITFGIKSFKSENVKNVIESSKNDCEVLKGNSEERKNSRLSISKPTEESKGHSKSLDKNSCSTMKNSMKEIMKDAHDPLSHSIRQTVQVEAKERAKAAVGKKRKLIVKECLPYNFIFGKSSLKDKYGVRELLYQQSPNSEREEILNCVSHLSIIRRLIKTRNDFNIMFLYDDLQRADTNESGYLPWDDVFQIIRVINEVPICKDKCETIINYFNLRNNDGQIDYMRFVDLMNELIPFPALGNLDRKHLTKNDLSTSYQKQTKDVLLPTTQSPEKPYRISKPVSYHNKIKLDDIVDGEMNIKSLISPSIPNWFGLSYKDYLLPRSKDQIYKIFTNAGFDLKDNNHFNTLFEKATKLPFSTGDKVSVEVFKYVLDKERSKNSNSK